MTIVDRLMATVARTSDLAGVTTGCCHPCVCDIEEDSPYVKLTEPSTVHLPSTMPKKLALPARLTFRPRVPDQLWVSVTCSWLLRIVGPCCTVVLLVTDTVRRCS